MKIPVVLLTGILLSHLLGPVTAEPRTTEVDPAVTGPNIVSARGPHRLISDSKATSNGLLLVTLGGTNSRPSDFVDFANLAASKGYKVASLDYPNSVISTKAREDGVPDGFTQFREEIVVGNPVSSIVEVDSANSIENRLTQLLRAAGPEYAEFLEGDKPRWNQIVAVGHSQGAGHAAYLGKRHPLRAVVMLAGPQDTNEHGVSPWLSMPSETAPESFFALLHRLDYFDCSKQLEAVSALRNELGKPSEQHVIVVDVPVRDAHMAVIESVSQRSWEAILGRVADLPARELVESLQKAANDQHRHPWAAEDPRLSMTDYSILTEGEQTWALTTTGARGPKSYAVWILKNEKWTYVFGYQNPQMLEGVDLAWNRRVDTLYKIRKLDPGLRGRLEDEKIRRGF